jgi:hypothetical protein
LGTGKEVKATGKAGKMILDQEEFRSHRGIEKKTMIRWISKIDRIVC